MHRILHGNQEAQEEIKAAVETKEVNFSQKIARGKYIHEILTHEVKPERLDDYLGLMYTTIRPIKELTDGPVVMRIPKSPRIPCMKCIMFAPCKIS